MKPVKDGVTRILDHIRALVHEEQQARVRPAAIVEKVRTVVRASARCTPSPRDFGPPVDVEPPSPDGFQTFYRPGYVKVAMNSTLAAQPGGGSSLFTETRAFATDASASRTFGASWRTILPATSWIRGAWLRAIKARAEK